MESNLKKVIRGITLCLDLIIVEVHVPVKFSGT
jgi:hypothetical protein